MLESEAMLRITGLTTRQMTHWITRGYLHPEGHGGSGYRFLWPPDEVRAAKLMKTLVDAGVAPIGAARAIRNDLILVPGVRVVLYTPTEDSQ